MPRALNDIIKELDTVYNPQRQQAKDVYTSELPFIDEQLRVQQTGLEDARKEFNKQAETRANRRGMFFSGIPIAEQARYFGSDFVPAMAGLKNRYQSQRNTLFNTLRDSLSRLDADQRTRALDIRNREQAREDELRREQEAIRQWEAEMALRRQAGSGGGGGGGGSVFNLGGSTLGANIAPQLTPRQQWQIEADQGDYSAQVALNYVGDDYRYDGPVNSAREYNILKSLGVQGNFFVSEPTSPAGTSSQSGDSSGLLIQGGGNIPSSSGLSTGLRRL